MTVVRPTDAAAAEPESFATLPTGFTCHGCGERPPAAVPAPMRCPVAVDSDGIDHLVVRTIDLNRVAWPSGHEANPFVRYRVLFHAYHVARALGWSDEQYVGRVESLDAAVAAIDGHGFVATPLVEASGLAARLGFAAQDGGRVLVKDETGNVSGSHKARHLFGTLLELELGAELERVIEPDGAASRADAAERPRFAIASCGNAALAAAVVARAAGRELLVFIPVDADPVVVERLEALGARVVVSEREPGLPGDPTYTALRRAIDAGAIGFTCQGNENGLAIEGGLTLGYELATDLGARGGTLDRLFVQVGGGALASSCIQALEEAAALGALARLPRIHAV
jgi:threonine synthase